MPLPQPHVPAAVVVMGVSGSGKTTVGRLAAQRLGWAFVDADDFHPPANREKMRDGQPLTDDDRVPWLLAVRRAIIAHLDSRQPVVVACSALTRQYRRILAEGEAQVRFVWLDVSAGELRQRLATRQDHFAGPNLLASQLETLEAPGEAVRVDGDCPLDDVVEAVVDAALSQRSASESG